MITVKAIAVDMAFANMGLAHVEITINEAGIAVRGVDLKLINTEREDHKEVRKSSDDLRRAMVLQKSLWDFCIESKCTLAFAEVPSGSQSASAARALGIAVGVLASCPAAIIEVSPMEVKKLFSPNGKRKVPKTEIIAWAVAKWPGLPWIRHKEKLTLANEHLADAMAVVMAGISTPAFKQLLALHKHETPTSQPQRPSVTRRALY